MRKRSYLLLSLIIILSLSYTVLGETLEVRHFDETLSIGRLMASDYTVEYHGQKVSLYTLYDELFIERLDLERLGCVIQEEKGALRINQGDQKDLAEVREPQIVSDETDAYLNKQSIYINHIKTYSLKTKTGCFIPLKALCALWDMEETQNVYTLKDKYFKEETYLKVEDGAIVNTSPYTLTFSYIQVYWKDNAYIDQIYEDQMIEAYGRIETEEAKLSNEQKMIYLTTFIQEIYDMPIYRTSEDYGQRPTLIFEAYSKAKRLRYLESVFLKYKVIVKFKYNVADFKEGEEAYLWRSENRQYHIIQKEDGKKVMVPLGSIEIVRDTGKGWKLASTVEIEDYVNLKNYESDTAYLLWTDVYRQLTYIFKGEKNNWNLIKTMKCSTGKNKSLTPTGDFKIEYKIPYFGMEKGYRCKNAVVIFRDYMYHSILFDTTGKYIRSGQYQLGSRVSHGCIRLSEQDSNWIYKNIPEQTKVYIE